MNLCTNDKYKAITNIWFGFLFQIDFKFFFDHCWIYKDAISPLRIYFQYLLYQWRRWTTTTTDKIHQIICQIRNTSRYQNVCQYWWWWFICFFLSKLSFFYVNFWWKGHKNLHTMDRVLLIHFIKNLVVVKSGFLLSSVDKPIRHNILMHVKHLLKCLFLIRIHRGAKRRKVVCVQYLMK